MLVKHVRSYHSCAQKTPLQWLPIYLWRKKTPYNGLQVPKPELSIGLLDMLILGLHTRTDASESLSDDQKLMF